MKLIFNGVEIPSNRTLLEKNGVVHVMLSYWGLRKRGLPKTKPYLIGEHFLPNMKVWVDSGAVQADKAGWSKQELEDYAADYEEFISLNYDRIEGWVEFDSQVLGFDWILQQRDVFSEDPKFFIVWHDMYGQNLLTKWGAEYRNIAIPGEAVENVTSLAAVVRLIKSQYSTQFMALATAKPDNLRQIPFDMAATLAWISPMRRGETIIWDGMKLMRYPKNMKSQARLRYKMIVEKAGLDFTKFVDDDTLEATKVAIWSYLQLEKKMDNNKDNIVSDNSDVEKRKVERTEVVQRDPNEVQPMPVFGYKMKTIVENIDGHDVLKEVPVVQSNNSSLRQCDTCFVAANCPAFKPANTCAFNLPVEVKTKEQLKALLTTVVEMQGQRVAFMRFAEEMNGGYADPNVSQEIDRLFKLVSSLKELETNKEFIQITASRQTEGGALSRIFGDRASVLRNLDKPLSEDQTTGIIRDALE